MEMEKWKKRKHLWGLNPCRSVRFSFPQHIYLDFISLVTCNFTFSLSSCLFNLKIILLIYFLDRILWSFRNCAVLWSVLKSDFPHLKHVPGSSFLFYCLFYLISSFLVLPFSWYCLTHMEILVFFFFLHHVLFFPQESVFWGSLEKCRHWQESELCKIKALYSFIILAPLLSILHRPLSSHTIQLLICPIHPFPVRQSRKTIPVLSLYLSRWYRDDNSMAYLKMGRTK